MIVVGAVPVVLLLVIGFERRWTSDDAFINFRVVQQILTGHGPVYNTGERVEAYTSPLWIALLTVFAFLGIRVEIVSVALGIIGSVAGLMAAEIASFEMIRRSNSSAKNGSIHVLFPLGAVVVASVPAVWDYVTSGLETGLVFGWLGVSYWMLARNATHATPQLNSSGASGPWRAATAFTIGLGPLVRPDLALIGIAFLMALVVVTLCAEPRRRQGRSLVFLVLVAGIVPIIYQIFRMGFFATLVANTALAKEASLSYWAQGGAYFGDFVETYVLWIPGLILLSWGAALFLANWSSRNWVMSALYLAPLVGGSAYALYVVRLGGDFMHGRLLLPSLFCCSLPIALVEFPRGRVLERLSGGCAGIVVLWSIACSLWLRVPYQNDVGPDGIADERGFYVTHAHVPNPITAMDHRFDDFAVHGLLLKKIEEDHTRVLLVPTDSPEAQVHPFAALPPGAAPEINLVASHTQVGLRGFNAGTKVFLIDRLGLADPITSRFRLGHRGGRPGHEKEMPYSWIIARWTTIDVGLDDKVVSAARVALTCGDLRELVQAVQEPLTPQRFVRNVMVSYQLTGLRFPGNPIEARDQLCGSV